VGWVGSVAQEGEGAGVVGGLWGEVVVSGGAGGVFF
jgi:hypothetical protein